MRTQPWMTSSSPTVATTSDSHSAGDDRSLVDNSTAGSSNIRFATTAPRQPPDDLGGDVQERCRGWSCVPSSRSVRVTTGLKCAPETAPNIRISPISAPAVAAAFSKQLQAHVGRRQLRRHDPRADHRHDQERGAERLGREPSGEVEAECAGAGLDLDARARCRSGAADPRSRRQPFRVEHRRRSGPAARARVASNAAFVPTGTGSGIDQCNHDVVAGDLLVGPVAHRDHQRAAALRRPSTPGARRPTGRARPDLLRRPRRDGPARRDASPPSRLVRR